MKVVGKVQPVADGARPHRKRLRSLAFVPTLLTLSNLLCGFAAIHFAARALYEFGKGVGPEQIMTLQHPLIERLLPSFLSIGASLVILGMILDCFDGLIARVTTSTTNFGGQLDSLADVVSFGVAPATLMVAFMTKELAGSSIVVSPISEHALGRFTWVCAALYVAMAAVRLARFNVEHAEADFDHRMFRGLPSPGAAAILVGLVLFQDHTNVEAIRRVLMYGTPIVAMAIAFLMVSRIPYRRFGRSYLMGRQPFGQFLVVMLVVAVFLAFKAETFLVVALAYGFSGPVYWVLRRIRERHAPPTVVSTTPLNKDRASA